MMDQTHMTGGMSKMIMISDYADWSLYPQDKPDELPQFLMS